MLSILTVNVGAAALPRAEVILRWLCSRPEDVFVLTETSAGSGTVYLLEHFRAAGFTVVHTTATNGERGTALISRVPLVEAQSLSLRKVSIPCRVAVATLETEPQTTVLSVYVPSRDQSVKKTAKKEQFVTSLLAAFSGMPQAQRGFLVVGGDYNVIARTHIPLHAGFLPFEFGFIEALERYGFVDAYEQCAPGEQPYSWVGRTGNGYRYDYFHVGQALAERIQTCAYLHETRQHRLTDHSAVTLSLDVSPATWLETSDPMESRGASLFESQG